MLASLLSLGLSGCMYDRYLTERQPTRTASATVSQPVLKTAQVPTLNTGESSRYYDTLAYQSVTVQRGDTLSRIADHYRVPLGSLIALNKIKPPYNIYPGQDIRIPAFHQHQVKSGETLYAISRLYNVDVAEVVHFNDMQSPYVLRPGAALQIPKTTGQGTQVAAIGNSGWIVPEREVVQTPRARSIAEKASVSRSVANEQLAPPAPRAAKVAVPVSVPETAAEKPVQLASLPKKQVMQDIGGEIIPKAELPPLPKKRYSIKHPPTRAGREFAWPAIGKILSNFGKKQSGFQNDGINISLKPGTPIRAAENGVVSYVGNEMRSFGNLILVSHSDGYVTTYGHLGETWVKKGDPVLKGDVIGVAGATGDVDSTQLHFEIRKNGKAKNPKTLLASR